MRGLARTLKTTACRLAGRECLLSVVRQARLRGKILVLMYHELAEDGTGLDAWTVVRRSEFERQIDYLQAHFEVLSFPDALRKMAEGSVSEPSCVLTFDDGYSGNHEVLLPLVTRRRLPVTIFIATAAVAEQHLYWYDRLLTAWESAGKPELDLRKHGLGVYAVRRGSGALRWAERNQLLVDLKALAPGERRERVKAILAEEDSVRKDKVAAIAPLTIAAVRELAASAVVNIGAHSHTHDILTQLSQGELEENIRMSKELLESWTGKPVSLFSYPNGDYDEAVTRAVEQHGFACGVTTSPRPWSRGESTFAIPRIGIGRYDSFDQFRTKVSGACRYASG